MATDKSACSRSVPWVRFGLTRPGLPLSVWPNRRETEKFDKLLRPRWLACQAPRRFLESRQGLVELGWLPVTLAGTGAGQEGDLGQVVRGGLQEKGWWKVFVTAWSGFLLSLFVMCLVMTPLAPQAGERGSSDAEPQLENPHTTLYVDVKSSTWRPRGRISFPVVPSLRMKLHSAGIAVVQNQTDPHDLILKVEYREERGRQFRIGLYETDIAFVASLEHPTEGELLRLVIRESSGLTESTNAPYLEVLRKFETNPYFYFLGDIIKGSVVSRRDTTGSLIEGLQRLQVKEEPIHVSPTDEQPSAAS